MFTFNIRNIVAVDREGMKWNAPSAGPAKTPIVPASVNTVANYIDELKKQANSNKEINPDKSIKMLEVANNIEKSQSTLGRSLARLHQSIPTPTTYEIGEQKAIAAFMSVGINQDKAEDYAEIFVDVIKKTQMDLSQLKISIDHKDGIDFQEMKDILLDPTNFTQENNKERFLSVFRGMKKTAVRTSNFGAHQFEQAISLYTKDASSLAKSVKDITGKDFGKDEKVNQAIANEYIKKINERSDFLSRMFALYNGAPQMGGLEAIMTGQDKNMLAELFARPDFADKLKTNNINSEDLLEYIKNTGITLPIPSLGIIGSYQANGNLKRNAEGSRADNSQKGEMLYAKSNVFGLVDQISGKEPASFGKVAADVIRTIIRPIEVGVSIDKRTRLVENSTLVAALSWNAIFDMKSGKVNDKWESNVDTIIGEFQKSNSLPDGFNKDSLVANMKEQVAYFDSIKQKTGDGVDAKNILILSQLRGSYVDQAAALTASGVDQGSKFDGVSGGLALLVLPFIKINTSSLAVNRVAVSSKDNDVAQTAARLTKNTDIITVDSLGFDHLTSANGEHEYSLKKSTKIDLTKVTLPEGSKLNDAKTSILSPFPLSIRMQQVVGVDASQSSYSELIVEKAKENTKKTELKDVFNKAGNIITFNSKIGSAIIDISGMPNGTRYDGSTKELLISGSIEVVMKPEQDASGKLTKIVVLPALSGTRDNTRLVESERNLAKNLGGSIYEMTRIRPSDSPGIQKTKKQFTEAMILIGDQKYEDAILALENMKQSQVAKNILKTLNGDNNVLATSPDKLAMILSYTYGAFDKNHEGVMGAKEYSKARSKTHDAEKLSATDRANDTNEAIFLKLEKHTPKSLSEIYGTDRAISVSVFATPKYGKHRIDKIDGAITVSDEARAGLTKEQKNAVIAEHDIAISSGLDRVNKILPKETQMSKGEYISILQGGNIDTKFAGLTISKPVEFFEARAMISGNRCANKVEGMILPTFAFKNTNGKYSIEQKVVTSEYSINSIFDGDRASVDSRTIGLGAMKNFQKTEVTDDRTPKPTTTPGTTDNGLITPPSGPNAPVITPPQPALPGTTPITTPITTPPGTTGPGVK